MGIQLDTYHGKDGQQHNSDTNKPNHENLSRKNIKTLNRPF
ncbi:hypothetical protein PMI02_04672 [Novosphingobium sp. AP12]|nr:hypothetical protein PMI02_04672 [Novosphingobium sp. AP12]